jgi:hypothetical protein
VVEDPEVPDEPVDPEEPEVPMEPPLADPDDPLEAFLCFDFLCCLDELAVEPPPDVEDGVLVAAAPPEPDEAPPLD